MSGAPGGGSRFRIQPDPPVAGSSANVTYVGPAGRVVYQIDGRPPVEVTPDEDGRFVIDPVPSGDELVLSDNRGLPGFLHRDIVEVS